MRFGLYLQLQLLEKSIHFYMDTDQDILFNLASYTKLETLLALLNEQTYGYADSKLRFCIQKRHPKTLKYVTIK